MRLVVSAGGTGGHIYPALAIIKKFQEKEANLEVLYIGTHNRMEKEIIPKNNIPYQEIKIYGFSKKKIWQDICNVNYLIKAYYKVIKILEDFKPDVVIGVGGYVTLPVIMAAKKLNIKTFIHEQNAIPGKTNKFLSSGVDGIFTSYESTKKYLKNIFTFYTGNPCSDNVLNAKKVYKEDLGLKRSKKLVLVVGGSLGSSSLNNKLKEFLNLSNDKDYEVLYITGKSNYDEFIKDTAFSSNIHVLPYLDNLSSYLHLCDLVISRSGAGITSEIVASKVPSILIPSPNVANNHQYYNALDLEKENLAIMIEEKDLDSHKLSQKVDTLLQSSNEEYASLKGALDKKKVTSSSEKIYRIVKESLYNAK